MLLESWDKIDIIEKHWEFFFVVRWSQEVFAGRTPVTGCVVLGSSKSVKTWWNSMRLIFKWIGWPDSRIAPLAAIVGGQSLQNEPFYSWNVDGRNPGLRPEMKYLFDILE